MHEAAIHQLRAELKHGKKETKVPVEEAQQEYDSQFAPHFHSAISPKYYSHVQSFYFL